MDSQHNWQKNKDRYELLRSYIAHEDVLINHRLTWLLVIQGLIFSAYSNLTKPMVDLTVHQHTNSQLLTVQQSQLLKDLHNQQFLLSYLGIAVCFAVYPGIIAAYRAINKIQEDYNQFPELPKLTGGGALNNPTLGVVTPLAIPPIILIAWFSMLSQIANYQKIVMFSAGAIIGVTLKL